jgi:hypothetical protein
MVYGSDITEGLPLVLSNATGSSYSANAESYDIAINDMPFFLNTGDEFPYSRATAQYRKQQIDQSNEPGEQSITGWWIRAQSSFHNGTGIKFYDPSVGEEVSYRFTDSKGVDVWERGKVTLLKDVVNTHVTTGAVVGTDHQHPNQHVRSIQWGGVNGVLLHDEFDVDKIYPSITVSITNKALTTNVATLTTSAAHGLTVGMTITITGVDATFNGDYRITTVPTTTTFTYAKTASNVASTAVSPVGTGVTNPVIHFIDYISGTDRKVHAICDDGVNAYWVTNKTAGGAQRLTMFKKPLTGDSITGSSNPSATGDVTQMFQSGDEEIIYAAMEFIKDRIILCVNNKVYEFPTSADAIGDGTLVYTNPNTNYHYTSVAASGPAIYTAGHSGIYSTIQKYTLSTAGAMPTLTSAVVAAELPAGEIIEKIYYYLGYMCIGTNQGIRVAAINDQDGSLSYGPLILETVQPVYDFAARDHYVWASTGVGALDGGLTRLDLSNELEPLRFAYANDLQVSQSTKHYTTGVAFLGTTNRLTFCTEYNTTDGAIYLESASTLVSSGYITTGKIRYGTLENKVFKNLKSRIDNSNGSLAIKSIDVYGSEYSIGTFSQGDFTPEVSVTYPVGAQEFLSLRFIISRSSTDNTKGPVFSGYQLRSLPSVPRQRLISYPLACYDREKDAFGNQVGHDGAAYEKLTLLEAIENIGDTVRVEDFRTGEAYLGIIEELQFVNRTPSDKRFTGFGGILIATIRTI